MDGNTNAMKPQIAGPAILDIQGRRFGRSDLEPGADLVGFFRRMRNGILLIGLDREPFAFVVTNVRQGRFFVSCSKHGRDIRYMFGTTSADEERLGIAGLSSAAEWDLVSVLVAQLNGVALPTCAGPSTKTMACAGEDFVQHEFV